MKKILSLIPGVLFLFAGLLNAQTLDKRFVTTNGAVRAIIQKGDTAFIGGDFTQLGMQSRGIAMFTPGETKPDINFPQLGINSTVNAIENDGHNGFYLAGNFTNFNGTIITTHSRILHILSSGSLDPLFGKVITDGDVYCMKLYNGKLYIGGVWINIQNTNRPYLAALDAVTGALDSWLPATPDNAIEKIEVSTSKVFISGNNIKSIGGYPVFTHFGVLKLSDGAYVNNFPVVNNNITAFAVSKNILYLGGNFDQAGASTRGIAKLSSVDANADPNFPSTNGMVLCVLPDGNGGYYIGGNFTKVGNRSRSNLAHILKNGAVDVAFNVTVKGEVLCLTTDSINLYFGGNFTSVNGITRHYVAAVSKTNGVLAGWDPEPDNSVLTLLRINNIIYLGGWFTKIKNTNRNFAAAVTTDGNLNNWTPEPDYYVNQIIAGNDGASVFMCGGFNNVKAITHEYVVKVNKTNGTPASWHPKPDNVVKSIALSGSIIYIAGSFGSVGGKARLFLAAVDTSSNTPTSFTADLNNFPNSISIASGKLYIAGNYSQIKGINISYLSRVDLASDIVDEWNPVSNAYVGTIYSDGTDVIAGGNFTLMNGLQKNLIASVNLNSNHFTTWNANGVASFNVDIISKIFTTGSDILIGGNFSYFDGFHTVHNVLVIDSVYGNISHVLTQYPTGTVNQFSIYNNKLMVGGSFAGFYDFSTQSNISRNNIAAYNQTNYSLSSSIYDANNSLTGMFTDASGNLIISGNFSLVNYVTRNYLAAINLSSAKVLSWNPSPDNTVKALAIKSSALYVGGTFKHIAGQARNYIASINVNSGKANTWSADCDSIVSAIAIRKNVAYIGGLFTHVKGTSRMHTAAISTTEPSSLKSWAPNPDSVVNAISTANNIYVGGSFSKVKNVTRNKLAKINSEGKLGGWSPNPDNSILCFSANDSTIFVGGNQFTTISKKSRNALAAFSINSNVITSFNPKLKFNNTAPEVNALALNDNILYIGTSALDELNGAARGRLAAADITNNNAINFNPLPDSSVIALSATNSYLLAGGLWNNLGNSVSPSYFAVFSLNSQSKPTPQKYFVMNNQTEKNITASNNSAVLYPNPAVNTVIINFKEEVNSTISLINTEGKTIWVKDNFIGRQLRLPVEKLASGTYFVLIETGKGAEKLKFVKE